MNVLPIHDLDWDSLFFQQKMGKIAIDPAADPSCFAEAAWRLTLNSARRQQYRYLFCEFDAAYKRIGHLLAGCGGSLGDVLVTLERDLNGFEPSGADFPVVPAVEEDLPEIIAMAADSFEHSRFFHDSRFDPAKVRQLYPQWVSNAFAGAEQFHVIKKIGKIQAFLSVQENAADQALIIRLLAVAGQWRGMGLGQTLLDWAADFAWERGLSAIRVGTQVNNYPAIRLYEKNRFRTIRALLRYHFWLEEQASAPTI